MTDVLETAILAAHSAGEVLRRQWPGARQVKVKGHRDWVTDADVAAQQAAAKVLRDHFPDHALLAEEGRHDLDLAGPTPTWIVDPLDGTTNYARRVPAFAVSVALAQGGVVQAGVIYDVLRRETFFAQRGGGAFVKLGRGRAQPIQVSDTADFAAAVAGLDWARDPALRDHTLQALARVATAGRTVRATGSAALGLAYVAAGRLDAYYHLSLAAWDVAAGALLVTEAGGLVSLPDGGPWRLDAGQVAASNGRLHSAFVQTMALGEGAA